MYNITRNCFLITLFLLTSCTKNEIKKISAEDFFKNPVKTSFLLSPDGKNISYLRPYKNRLNIFVQSIDGNQITRVTSDTDRGISVYFWGNNNEIVYLKDNVVDEYDKLYAVGSDGKNKRSLIPYKNVQIRLLDYGPVKYNQVLISMNQRDSSAFDAFRVNIKSNKLTLIGRNPGNIKEWYADRKGKLRMAIASDGVKETLLYRRKEQDPFRAVVTSNFKTVIDPVGFCEESNCIYALSNQNKDKTALVEFDCSKGKEKRTLFSSLKADIEESVYSPKKKKMEYAVYETWKRRRFYLDDSVKQMYTRLEALLPGEEIRIAHRDDAEQKFIIKTQTDRNPGAFYLYTPAENKLTKLSDVNPAIKKEDMCEMKPIKYTSRDGLTINGYLTLPKSEQYENFPVVVMPHNGPTDRDSWEFNAEVQFLASRGYAVFQMNYRGSAGYGKEFWIAGFKEWGNKMQDDITDGVKWLIKERIADPKRIAIYGSNFGGYSALHGLCFEPDMFACGASYSGLINLFTFLKSVPPYYMPFRQMYYEMVGNPETDADYFRAASPVFHSDKIKVPVLVAQGAKDPRVNVNETNQFVTELKNRGVPVTYILKEDEAHYFRNQENRLEFYQELEKFLAANLNKK